MANWSDTETLVNYLRHVFITCDETGVCEAVIENPVPVEKPGGIRIPAKECGGTCSDDSDSEEFSGNTWQSGNLSNSPDIHPDPGHRGRSNTAKQLELLKQQRMKQGRKKVVQWRPPVERSAEELEALFPRKCLPSPQPQNTTSLVSKMIREAASHGSHNPFQKYARFEATQTLGVPVKTFGIFLPMLGEESSENPLRVEVTETAKVSDMIGLICHKYTAKNLQPPLRANPQMYVLHMAEECGEIEADLPPLNSSETVLRVGFPFLALVQRPHPPPNTPNHVITVFFPNGDTYKVILESLNVPLHVVRDKVLEQRAESKTGKEQLEYNLEKVAEPDVPLPLAASVQTVGTAVFIIVRKNSSRGDFVPGARKVDCEPEIVDDYDVERSSHVYNIEMVHRFKGNKHVQLAIYQDRIDITSIGEEKLGGRKGSKIFRSSTATGKTHSLPLDQLGGAQLVQQKHSKKLFRLVHRADSDDWRSHYFESDAETAEEIVETVNTNLSEVACPEVREAFLRRPTRKPSIFRRLKPQLSTTSSKGPSSSSSTWE